MLEGREARGKDRKLKIHTVFRKRKGLTFLLRLLIDGPRCLYSTRDLVTAEKSKAKFIQKKYREIY